jgi:hypothetical protein
MAARGGCVVVGRGNCEKVPLGFSFFLLLHGWFW